MKSLIVLALIGLAAKAYSKECFVGKVFATEDMASNTCTKTCEEASGNSNRAGCSKIKNCRKHMTGWTRGFVRCDICECDCYKNCGSNDKCRLSSGNTVRRVYIEPDLNSGSCTQTCGQVPNHKDKFGCAEIKNCHTRYNGWTRGFVRCDICECDCVLPTLDPFDLEPGVMYPGRCISRG